MFLQDLIWGLQMRLGHAAGERDLAASITQAVEDQRWRHAALHALHAAKVNSGQTMSDWGFVEALREAALTITHDVRAPLVEPAKLLEVLSDGQAVSAGYLAGILRTTTTEVERVLAGLIVANKVWWDQAHSNGVDKYRLVPPPPVQADPPPPKMSTPYPILYVTGDRALTNDEWLGGLAAVVHHGKFSPVSPFWEEDENPQWAPADMLRNALPNLMRCHGVAVIPGVYDQSKVRGSRLLPLELEIAETLNLPVKYLAEWVQL